MVNSGGSRRGWGAPAQNTGTNIPSVNGNKLSGNQHSSDSADGNGKKFTNGWKSTEEEDQVLPHLRRMSKTACGPKREVQWRGR